VDRRNDLRLERVTLDLERQNAPLGHDIRCRASLGDFYAQLGRGLVLSLRRIDELGIDVALRGARGEVALADDQVLVTVLGGVTNPVNIERQYLVHLDDPGDRVAAARAEGRIGEVVLGAHGVGVREEKPEDPMYRRQSLAAGGTLDVNIGPGSLGFEVDAQRRRVFGVDQDGWAAFGVGSIAIGRWTLLAEGKHYVRFAPMSGSKASAGERFIYSYSPTAERVDQEIVDNTNVTGGRVRADLALSEDGTRSLHGSFGVFRNRALQQWISHDFGGIDWRWPGGIAVQAVTGYRREWLVDGGSLLRAIAHGELDALVPLSPRLALHGIVKHESHVEAVANQRQIFHRGGSSLELDIADRLVLAAGVDWDTQNRSDGVANGFGFGVIRWRQNDAFIVQILAGTQRGGIRCLAGACRLQPSFSGVRLDLTVRL
jgi:hypothetical protein